MIFSAIAGRLKSVFYSDATRFRDLRLICIPSHTSDLGMKLLSGMATATKIQGEKKSGRPVN